MKVYEARVMLAIEELAAKQPNLSDLIYIITSPQTLKGVYAKEDIGEGELFIAPVSDGVSFAKKVPAGACNLHKTFTANGVELHACLRPHLVTVGQAHVRKDEEQGVHATAGKTEFMSLFFHDQRRKPKR